ncbi:5-oxoprolinase subunit PxpB [Rhodobacteraceae bacterium F11138]|nr:5-oxoprolinase subunit PxpB [Rhodobacteraceae bacterium F11138]
MTPSFLPSGDRALMLKFSDSIDASVNARLVGFADRLRQGAIAGLVEIVPTYGSLLICYDPEHLRGAALEKRLLALWEGTGTEDRTERYWEVPCLYGGEVGQDLDDLAADKNLTRDELIALHAGAEYRVYMIGFAPGFAYLGGLPEILHTPRLTVPRQNIPEGAIGIGGRQASINSVAGPSGWRFIGWTPWRSFDPARPEPCLFRAGDRIRFRPVDTAEARDIAAGLSAGDVIPEPLKGEGAA